MFIDISKLQNLKTLIVLLDAWADWCGTSDSAALNARVVWPLAAGDDLNLFPIIALECGPANYQNQYGYDSSANFLPSGMIRLKIWAEDTLPNDRQASYEAFGAKANAFVEELIENAHTGPLIIGDISTPEVPVIHSHQLDADTNDPPHWLGLLNIPWGLSA